MIWPMALNARWWIIFLVPIEVSSKKFSAKMYPGPGATFWPVVGFLKQEDNELIEHLNSNKILRGRLVYLSSSFIPATRWKTK